MLKALRRTPRNYTDLHLFCPRDKNVIWGAAGGIIVCTSHSNAPAVWFYPIPEGLLKLLKAIPQTPEKFADLRLFCHFWGAETNTVHTPHDESTTRPSPSALSLIRQKKRKVHFDVSSSSPSSWNHHRPWSRSNLSDGRRRATKLEKRPPQWTNDSLFTRWRCWLPPPPQVSEEFPISISSLQSPISIIIMDPRLQREKTTVFYATTTTTTNKNREINEWMQVARRTAKNRREELMDSVCGGVTRGLGPREGRWVSIQEKKTPPNIKRA